MVVRALFMVFLTAMLLASAGQAALAEKRVALVIGNGAYKKAPELANPRNDADDMAAALKALGFTVILGLDLDKRAMDKKVLEFESALSGADAGVFHYSGHGLQVAGVNYLVPVDAELASVAALRIETVRLDFVQETMEREAKTNILFLDACRNNPLARNLARALGTRSAEIGRGLAATEAGVGTLISFSTQPNNVALDGSGRTSPYSGPLAKAIGTPGQDLFSILIAVRNEVLAATGGKQVPWEHSALRASFYFKPAAPAASSGPPTATPPFAPDAQAWSVTQNTTSEGVLEEFIRRFPDSVYAHFARARLGELRKEKTAGADAIQTLPEVAKSSPLFDVRLSAEVVGAPIGSFNKVDQAQCEQRCISLDYCAAYTYSQENNRCYLYREVQLRPNSHWVSGITTRTVEPSKNFEIRANTEALGNYIFSMKISTTSECEKQCLSRANCAVYTYNLGNKSCYLYAAVRLNPTNVYWVSGIRKP